MNFDEVIDVIDQRIRYYESQLPLFNENSSLYNRMKNSIFELEATKIELQFENNTRR